MITSNINELTISTLLNKNYSVINNGDFINEIYQSKLSQTIIRTDALTYDNIKGISIEEIETLFKDSNKIQEAKNLRLATLFSNDDILGQAMFNTVLGQPFGMGYSFLYDRYEDKHNFLNSNSYSLSDFLHDVIINKINDKDKKVTDVISDDKLKELLTTINSFNFIETLTNTSKNQYDKYKDKNSDYSFLYNDYNLQYMQLKQQYQELEDINKSLINQY
jgi:hypothetical protein